METKIENGKTILGIFLHVGHIFSGYKEMDIAQFARGLVMGITLTFDNIIEGNSNDLLPESPVPSDLIDFGIHNLLKSFYFSEAIDRKSLKYQTNKLNAFDLSEIKKKAKKEIEDFSGSSKAFFIDPKVTKKQ